MSSEGTAFDKEGLPAALIEDDRLKVVTTDTERLIALNAKVDDLNQHNLEIVRSLRAILVGVEIIADIEPDSIIEDIDN